MKGFYLSEEELLELRTAHRSSTRASCAYRINAVILLGTGWTLQKVKDALLIDDETLRGYVNRYCEGGIPYLLETNHKGSSPKLDSNEQAQLVEELETNIYMTTHSVIDFVSKQFDKDYSPSGMRDLLHRLGYEYKKPKLVPGNPDFDAQEEFVGFYEEFIENKADSEKVLFMDAVHPEHNAIASCGWIRRGQERQLKTNSGRQRLNLHGAIDVDSHALSVIESDTVNADSTITLLSLLEKKYETATALYVILDNARYHYSKKVREFVKGTKIRLVFLPSYSPNLNLIEPIWKFFKKKVLYNTYYPSLEAFRKACIKFFKGIGKHKDEVGKIMRADFHLCQQST